MKTYSQSGSPESEPLCPGEACQEQRSTDVSAGMMVSGLEHWINIAWLIGGSILCVYAWKLNVWGHSGPDSGFFPMIAGVIILLGGLIQWAGMRMSRVPVDDQPFWERSGASRRVLTLLAGIVLLLVLIRYAGFIVAALLTMPFLIRQVEKRSWLYAIVVGVIATLTVHAVFGQLLGMHMPRGLLGF